MMWYWYPVCYAEGVISKYLQSTIHLGYEASLRCNSRTIFEPAEKIEDLAAKHDDVRSVRLTGLTLMNFHHEIQVDTDQILRDFDPPMTVEYTRILLVFNFN